MDKPKHNRDGAHLNEEQLRQAGEAGVAAGRALFETLKEKLDREYMGFSSCCYNTAAEMMVMNAAMAVMLPVVAAILNAGITRKSENVLKDLLRAKDNVLQATELLSLLVEHTLGNAAGMENDKQSSADAAKAAEKWLSRIMSDRKH